MTMHPRRRSCGFFGLVLFCVLMCGCWKNPEPETVDGAEDGSAQAEQKSPVSTGSASSKVTRSEEELLVSASVAYDKGLYSVSQKAWSELRDSYPTGYFAPLAELKIADAYFYAENYPAAQTAYEEFKRLHPAHEAIAYLLFQLGNCQLEQFKGIGHDQTPLSQSYKFFRQVIDEHPQSAFAPLARKRIDSIRHFQAEGEAEIAKFYIAQGNAEASAGRLQKIREAFPETKIDLVSLEAEESEAGLEAEELLKKNSLVVGQKAGTKRELPVAPQLVFLPKVETKKVEREVPSDAESKKSARQSISDTPQQLAPLAVTKTPPLPRPQTTKATVQVVSAPRKESAPLLSSLYCGIEGGIFVAVLQTTAKYQLEEQGSFEAVYSLMETAENPTEPAECEIPGAGFLIVEKLAEKIRIRSVAGTDSASRSKLTTFGLDRPYRLVVVSR